MCIYGLSCMNASKTGRSQPGVFDHPRVQNMKQQKIDKKFQTEDFTFRIDQRENCEKQMKLRKRHKCPKYTTAFTRRWVESPK